MRPVICCEHNECPDRPRRFLGRFERRPWRCPQCGQWWHTAWHAAYDSGVWEWERCDTEEREFPADRVRRQRAERTRWAGRPDD